MGVINESFISVFDTLDQSAIKEGELQSLQLKLKKDEDLIARLEMFEGTQVVEISWQNERVSQLKDELRVHDQKIEALTLERVDLI